MVQGRRTDNKDRAESVQQLAMRCQMTSDRLARTDLPGYFRGISQRLELQVKLMTPVIVHSGEMGDNDHGWFADLLRQYLPQKYGVDTGFVVNHESDKGSADFFDTSGKPRSQDPSISPQMDILVLDVLHNAPFCSEKTFKVCPIEMVLGAIEVTRDLDGNKLKQDCDKLCRMRGLAKDKKYSRGVCLSWVWPITFAVGLRSSLSEDNLLNIVGTYPHPMRPDGIFLLDRAFYWFHQSGREFHCIEEDRLFHFIAVLQQKLGERPGHGVDLQAYFSSSVFLDQLARRVEEKPKV
jgi:hypothetical protein